MTYQEYLTGFIGKSGVFVGGGTGTHFVVEKVGGSFPRSTIAAVHQEFVMLEDPQSKTTSVPLSLFILTI